MRGPCKVCIHCTKKKMFGQMATVCTKNPPIILPLPGEGLLAGQMGIQLTSLSPGVNLEDEYGCCEPEPGKQQVGIPNGGTRLAVVKEERPQSEAPRKRPGCE